MPERFEWRGDFGRVVMYPFDGDFMLYAQERDAGSGSVEAACVRVPRVEALRLARKLLGWAHMPDAPLVPDEVLTAQLRRQRIVFAAAPAPVHPPFHAYEADLREAGIL